jgi:glycerol-3-phosphate dehydrogenase
LLRSRPGQPSSLSREFRLHESATGLVTALGGKYTTFRSMAEAIVDHLATRLGKRGHCRTHSLPLVGAPKGPWPEFAEQTCTALVKRYPIAPDSAAHLVRRYGDQVEAVMEKMSRSENGFARIHAEEPDLIGEQAWQRDEEIAIFPEDLLLRRTRIGMWRPDLLRACTPSSKAGCA